MAAATAMTSTSAASSSWARVSSPNENGH
jgi:hypothetical protein